VLLLEFTAAVVMFVMMADDLEEGCSGLLHFMALFVVS